MQLEIPQPWLAFLRDVDRAVSSTTVLHCLGGFVIAMQYGMPRPTGDIDLLSVFPDALRNELASLAGKGSPLHSKHKVYLDFVVLRVEPADYRDRLLEMFPGVFERIHLMALDPYDLALSKLDRNSPRDREDFLYLAASVPLDMTSLRVRYEAEVAPYVFEATEKTLRLSLDLWIASAEELGNRSAIRIDNRENL